MHLIKWFQFHFVQSIEFDPNNWIINQTGSITENVNLVGIDEKKTDEIVVFPNPVTDVLYVANTSNAKQVSIFDLNGRLVLNQSLVDGQNEIMVKDLPKGTYIVQFGKVRKEIVVR